MRLSRRNRDKEFGRNPIGPKGCGGTAPLPLSLLLANAHTLTRRRFAEIGAVALATIAMLFRKRATRGEAGGTMEYWLEFLYFFPVAFLI